MSKLCKFEHAYFVWLKKKNLEGFKQLFQRGVWLGFTPRSAWLHSHFVTLCFHFWYKRFPMMMPWFLPTWKKRSKNTHEPFGSRCPHPGLGTAVESTMFGEEITTAGPLRVPTPFPCPVHTKTRCPCCPHTQASQWQLAQAEGWVYPQGPSPLRSNTCWIR